MPSNTLNIGCDLAQGFNFRKDVMSQVGVVAKLKIGEIDLAPDIVLKDPENNQNDKKAVGVLSHIAWGARRPTPSSFMCRLAKTPRTNWIR